MATQKIGTSVESILFNNIPDEIYGSGADGNVTISSNTTLTRDMYYNNLTIGDGANLNTNGYRVFVRNSLSFSNFQSRQSFSSIGLKNGSSAVGSISGGGLASVTNSLGGASAAYTVTAPVPANYYSLARNAVLGYTLNASQTTPLVLKGGAGNNVNYGGGITIVVARKVSGYGTLYATGYNNGSSYVTGGGVIVFISQSARTSNLAVDVSGYSSGTVKEFIV